jgi:hypothetical protein
MHCQVQSLDKIPRPLPYVTNFISNNYLVNLFYPTYINHMRCGHKKIPTWIIYGGGRGQPQDLDPNGGKNVQSKSSSTKWPMGCPIRLLCI